MNKTIQVCYRWSVEEMLLINKLHMRYSTDGRKLRRKFYLFGVVIFVIPLITSWQYLTYQSAVVLIVSPIVILALMLFSTRRAIRKAYARKADRDLPITYELSEDRLISRTEISTVDSLWRAIRSVVKTPEGFLLYTEERQLHWLPVRGFSNPEEVEQFAEFARTKIQDFSDKSQKRDK
jgi:hypothetical protein